MIHFLPDPGTAAAVPQSPCTNRADALARALAVVQEMAGETPATSQPSLAAQLALAGSDDLQGLACDRAVTASAAGLEAIALLAEAGGSANPAAARLLADTIRDTLDEMGARLSL